MKYFYDMADTFNHNDNAFYTEEEVAAIHLYEATPDVIAKAEDEDDEWNTLWPVYDISSGWSWELADCKDESEARKLLMLSLNQSVYEHIHDI